MNGSDLSSNLLVKGIVRGKEGSYPTSIIDGYAVYSGSGNSTSDSGLNPGTTYFYSAWSEVTDGSTQYSDDPPAQANATTTSGVPTVIGGIVLKVNKASLLAPWVGLGIAGLLIATRLYFYLRRRSRSRA